MAFEWFPILAGKYLSFKYYLALSGSLFFFLCALFLLIMLMIHKKYHNYVSHKSEIKTKLDLAIFNSQDSSESRSVRHGMTLIPTKLSFNTDNIKDRHDKYES